MFYRSQETRADDLHVAFEYFHWSNDNSNLSYQSNFFMQKNV